MNRTCLSLIKDQHNLGSMEKTSLAFLNPVQSIDNNNKIYNVLDAQGNPQCAFPKNTEQLFGISTNTMSVPNSFFWDDPSVTTDKVYNFSDSPNSLAYPNQNIVNNSEIPNMAHDSYYSLFQEDIQQIISYCNLVKSYTVSNAQLYAYNLSLINDKNQINAWLDETKTKCAKIESQTVPLKNQLKNLKPVFNNIKNEYNTLIPDFNNKIDVYNNLLDQIKQFDSTTQYKSFSKINMTDFQFNNCSDI
jgi:hypothetical protein